MFVKPKDKDMVVRDPRTRAKLPVDGANVPDTSYWHRRLRAGDVVLATKNTQPKKAFKKEEV